MHVCKRLNIQPHSLSSSYLTIGNFHTTPAATDYVDRLQLVLHRIIRHSLGPAASIRYSGQCRLRASSRPYRIPDPPGFAATISRVGQDFFHDVAASDASPGAEVERSAIIEQIVTMVSRHRSSTPRTFHDNPFQLI